MGLWAGGPDPHGDPAGVRADADSLVAVLHDDGPAVYAVLRDSAAAAGWPGERLEHAVADAWGAGRIFVDGQDRIVAL
ncbi:MAG: hypothetical protein ACLGI3_07585 [Actinomycetes bacterium]